MSVTRRRVVVLYAAGVVVPVAALIAVLVHAGEASGGGKATPAPATSPTLQVNHTLAVIAVLIIVAHLGGVAAKLLRQPTVIGQATAGLLAGPSLLGHLVPPASGWLHSGGADQAVDLLAQLGVVLFVFLVARELAGSDHRVGPAAVVLGHTMVAIPLLAGVVTAVVVLPAMRPANVAAVPYGLFIGLAMSATALPVLAHILAERRQLTSPVGVLGTAGAAAGDAGIWCALAVALSLAGHGSLPATLLRLAGAVGFAAVLWWVVRPLLRRLLPPDRDSRYAGPALLIGTLLLCAVITEELGLHAVFGAFLFGLALPRRSVLVQRLSVSTDGITQWLLLPLFFTAIGSRARLDLINTWHAVAVCGIVLLVAVVSKVVAAGGAGLALGLSRRDSAMLAAMMNCRGLTELVLLTVGLKAGILDGRTFTVFVIMALVTTAATGPLLGVLGMPRTAAAPATSAPAGSSSAPSPRGAP